MKFTEAYLSDSNEKLINAYKVIKDKATARWTILVKQSIILFSPQICRLVNACFFAFYPRNILHNGRFWTLFMRNIVTRTVQPSKEPQQNNAIDFMDAIHLCKGSTLSGFLRLSRKSMMSCLVMSLKDFRVIKICKMLQLEDTINLCAGEGLTSTCIAKT